MPYFVTTKLSKIRRSSVLVPSPKAYVASALATCGLTSRTFGCLSHEAQVQVSVHRLYNPPNHAWKTGYLLCLYLGKLNQ